MFFLGGQYESMRTTKNKFGRQDKRKFFEKRDSIKIDYISVCSQDIFHNIFINISYPLNIYISVIY